MFAIFSRRIALSAARSRSLRLLLLHAVTKAWDTHKKQHAVHILLSLPAYTGILYVYIPYKYKERERERESERERERESEREREREGGGETHYAFQPLSSGSHQVERKPHSNQESRCILLLLLELLR